MLLFITCYGRRLVVGEAANALPWSSNVWFTGGGHSSTPMCLMLLRLVP